MSNHKNNQSDKKALVFTISNLNYWLHDEEEIYKATVDQRSRTKKGSNKHGAIKKWRNYLHEMDDF